MVIDACGINHFTWITEANYDGRDMLALLPEFIDRFYDKGYCEHLGVKPDDFREDPFRYGNKVKMDLFRRFGVLAAAGDRHLVEFMDRSWYLKNKADAENWLYHLTTVSYRKQDRINKVNQSRLIADGKEEIKVVKSDEEVVKLMKALLGLIPPMVSNANTLNVGQMAGMPIGSVVETNCVFSRNSVKPVVAKPLPGDVNALVLRNAQNIENAYYGIVNQPLCSGLALSDARELFVRMVKATDEYLRDYFPLDKL